MNQKRWIWLGVSILVGCGLVGLMLLPAPTRQNLLKGLGLSNASAVAADQAAPPESAFKLTSDDTLAVTDEGMKIADIQTMPVKPSDVPVTLTLTGKTALNLDMATHVHAQFGGKVTDVRVKLGDKVLGPAEAGGPTILCVIESNDLAQDKAAFLQSKIQLQIDTDTRDRLKELVKGGFVNEKQLIDAESAVVKDQAALEATRQQLLIFGLKQSEIDDIESQVGKQRMDYLVTAPRSGIIAEKGVAGGEIADPTLNLFTIADTKTLWVLGDVYERDLRRIQTGQALQAFFTSEPARARDSRIDWISPTLDPNTHSARIQGILDNSDGHLLADMYGTIIVALDPGGRSLVVPATSVIHQDSDAFVFIQSGRDGSRIKFRRTPVRVDAIGVGFGSTEIATAEGVAGGAGKESFPAMVRIVEGIKPGDIIVTRGGLGMFTEMIQQANGQ